MITRITPEEAAQLLRDGYVYLDVRNPDEFALGHPKDAYNIPWLDPEVATRTPNPRFIEVVTNTFAPDQRLIIGCQTGRRSLSAAELLIEKGFTNIVEQRAGFATVPAIARRCGSSLTVSGAGTRPSRKGSASAQ